MSSTVEICLRHPGDAAAVMARLALAFEVPGYFAAADGFRFTLRSAPWTVQDGVVSIEFSELDHELYGVGDETAFAPYEFELSLELQNVPGTVRGELRERAGRAVFDRLTELDVPVAFGDGTDLFVDFLPGRGVRDFPAGTSWDEDDRDAWFEPRLHGPDAAPREHASPSRPTRGAVRVYETGGLAQIVPWSDSGPLTPVASVRTESGPAFLGRVLAESFERSEQDAPTTADPWPWVTGIAGLSPDEYVRTAVSFDIRADDGTLHALPHERGTSLGSVGPAIDSLVAEQPGPWGDEHAGRLVQQLIESLRAQARS